MAGSWVTRLGPEALLPVCCDVFFSPFPPLFCECPLVLSHTHTSPWPMRKVTTSERVHFCYRTLTALWRILSFYLGKVKSHCVSVWQPVVVTMVMHLLTAPARTSTWDRKLSLESPGKTSLCSLPLRWRHGLCIQAFSWSWVVFSQNPLCPLYTTRYK